ncbi:MAG: hypothetical protein ACE5Z5_11890 [Candidatus Bathyarchaeia archaeon]
MSEAKGEANVEEKAEEVLACPVCGAEVRPIETPTGITYRCDSCRKFVTPRKRGEVPLEEVLKPAEIEMTERVVEELAGKLRTVYGISKQKVVAIIDTIRGNPNIALNPMNLFMHIKQLEPRAHDYHLWIVINGLFQKLRTAGWMGVVPPFQTIQQQMYQQQPWMYGGWQWQQPYQQAPFTFGYGAPVYTPGRRTPSPPMKVVVEGQEVETDMAGYMAWRRWESDRKKDEAERREHELRMKKLEAEIKEIESRATGAKREGEEKVEVEVEGQKFTVPASLAPAYLALRGPKESEETKKLRDDVSKLRDELHKKEIESLERQIGDIAQKLENQPSFWEQLKGFEEVSERLGYKRSGRTALDVLDSLGERVDQRAQQIISRFPGVGEEFRPEVTRTVEEREREARRLEKRLERSKEVLQAEDDLLRAAAKVKV